MARGQRGKGSRREAREALYRETSNRYESVLGEPGAEEAAPEEELPVEPAVTDPEDLGWRTSRRTSRVAKGVRKTRKREERAAATREVAGEAARAGGRVVGGFAKWTGITVGSVVGLALVLFVLANATNWYARWDAQRNATGEPSPAEIAQDNILVIGADDQTVAGFLAIRIEEGENRVFGIAIPDAAFMEVPGQGFERAGDSYRDGADVSAAAISNFLSVTFDQWVVVDVEAYQAALQDQSLGSLLDTVLESNMSTGDVGRFARAFGDVGGEEVALVPLPVKPISLGDETYFEPQREEVADLLYSWWGVSMGSDKDVIRVIVYNGSGEPGIAGAAAQELIRQGFRVVETRNADNFDYEETLVVLYHGELVDAERIREALDIGVIMEGEASQQIADVIVIVGSDYAPPPEDG